MRISVFGVILTIIAIVGFTILACSIFDLWGLLIGPIVALLAARPAKVNGSWLWQKHK